MRITLQDVETTPPVDAPVIHNRASIAPYARAEFDPPTPLSIQIVNHSIARFLVRISLLKQSSSVNDQIQALHDEIMDFSEHLPPYLWVENPDERFDSHPDCFWLPDARQAVESTIWFAILALHRPYIFKSSKNRVQALKAGLCTLRAEKRVFADLPLRKCRSFSYLFATFDAAVTVAVIYTLYPEDSPRSFEEAIQGIEMVLTQFDNIALLNPLADTAAKVLRALHVRIRRSTRSPSLSFSGSSAASNAESLSNPWTPPTVPGIGTAKAVCATDNYIEHNLEAVPPPLPLHDLLYKNLSGTSLNTDLFTDFSEQQPENLNTEWQFQGQFDNDAFWNIMNQIEP
jgi:hypothetical protein